MQWGARVKYGRGWKEEWCEVEQMKKQGKGKRRICTPDVP